METAPNSFTDFWPHYLAEHSHPTCRLLHVTGGVLAWSCVALSPLYPPLLLAAPLVGYPLSWLGHFLYERNRPASWSSPKYFAWSFVAGQKMNWLVLTGGIERELARYREQHQKKTP